MNEVLASPVRLSFFGGGEVLSGAGPDRLVLPFEYN